MAINDRTYDDVAEAPGEVAQIEVQAVLQRWVAERVSWLKSRTLQLGASKPAALLQRAVIPPKRILQAADPRELFRSISHTSARIGTRLTQLAASTLPREQKPTAHESVQPTASGSAASSSITATARHSISAGSPSDTMWGYWKARVDVLQKLLEKKPEL
jgi:hypothetical protein